MASCHNRRLQPGFCLGLGWLSLLSEFWGWVGGTDLRVKGRPRWQWAAFIPASCGSSVPIASPRWNVTRDLHPGVLGRDWEVGVRRGAATRGEGVNDGGRPVITLTARRMKVTDGRVPSLHEPCGGGRSLPGAEK